MTVNSKTREEGDDAQVKPTTRWLAAVLTVLFSINNFDLKSEVSCQIHLHNTIESKCNAVIFFISLDQSMMRSKTITWKSSACYCLMVLIQRLRPTRGGPSWRWPTVSSWRPSSQVRGCVAWGSAGCTAGDGGGTRSLAPQSPCCPAGMAPCWGAWGCSSSLSACKNPAAAGGKRSHA